MDKIEDLINKVHNCDCLDLLKQIPDRSVDMILQDPPYNVTDAKWDINIFDRINEYWQEWRRIAKKDCPILFSATQPFTSKLVMSNEKVFKYEWIWEKSKASNFVNARRQPLKAHENILVFCYGRTPYYPQKTKGKPYSGEKRAGKKGSITEVYANVPNPLFRRGSKDGTRFPRTVIYFATAETEGKQEHSTQKPLALFKYLIETYTQPGNTVFDGFAGSFTTAVAAESLERNWICCELLKEYCDIGQKRIDELRAKN